MMYSSSEAAAFIMFSIGALMDIFDIMSGASLIQPPIVMSGGYVGW